MSRSVSLSICIVVHSAVVETIELLRALINACDWPATVVLVDNDGRADELIGGISRLVAVDAEIGTSGLRGGELAVWPVGDGSVQDVYLVRGLENKGFGSACNVGAAVADRVIGAEYCLFLNPDAIPLAGCLSSLMGLAQSGGGSGMAAQPAFVGAAVLDRPGASRAVLGGEVSTVTGRTIPVYDLPPAARSTNRSTRERVASGACLLVRLQEFWRAGGFDERQFLYYEELSIRWRYRRQGLADGVIVAEKAQIAHKGGATTGAAFGSGQRSWISEFHGTRSAIIAIGTEKGKQRGLVVAAVRAAFGVVRLVRCGCDGVLAGTVSGLRALWEPDLARKPADYVVDGEVLPRWRGQTNPTSQR